jgi:transcriptional regulator with XRE-family HTH domain
MNRAKQLRIDSGMGLVDTADGAGISTLTLKKIERGEDVQPASLVKLATFWGRAGQAVKPSELYAPVSFDERSAA